MAARSTVYGGCKVCVSILPRPPEFRTCPDGPEYRARPPKAPPDSGDPLSLLVDLSDAIDEGMLFEHIGRERGDNEDC
jgi:hypothetical protein